MAKKTIKKQKSEEVQILENFNAKNAKKTERVASMETLVHDFDIRDILTLNEELRVYYKTVGDAHILDLLDQMTDIMRDLSEIINQVKAKRISLEQGQKEIQEKLTEINEVLLTMKDWEATGI
jgi:Holliday junction resolvasome RuvABC endonuclease subunit